MSNVNQWKKTGFLLTFSITSIFSGYSEKNTVNININEHHQSRTGVETVSDREEINSREANKKWTTSEKNGSGDSQLLPVFVNQRDIFAENGEKTVENMQYQQDGAGKKPEKESPETDKTKETSVISAWTESDVQAFLSGLIPGHEHFSSHASSQSGPKLLNVPLISQYPEPPSGCEATVLAMALQYYGIHVSKTKLADEMPYDPTPIKRDSNRRIIEWGDPEVGYVGNPYNLGTTINPNPLKKLLDKYRSGGIALYGQDFSVIENYVNEGKPTLVWFTLHYQMPAPRTWKTPAGKEIYAPRPLHCVLVTGVDSRYVYFHDSDANRKNVRVAREHFEKVYNAMGRRALVVS